MWRNLFMKSSLAGKRQEKFPPKISSNIPEGLGVGSNKLQQDIDGWQQRGVGHPFAELPGGSRNYLAETAGVHKEEIH